jgi:hypothetical protein
MKKLILLLSVITFALMGCGDEQSAEYRSNLQSLADDMLENAAEAENVLNQYAAVWSHSIQSSAAIPVSEMVSVTGMDEDAVMDSFQINSAGNIPNDFSMNVNSMALHFESTGKLQEIEQSAEEISKQINELNNPPEEYEKAYDELLDMYTYTEEYTEMAISPSGSLQEFNDKRSQLSSDILSQHKRIEALLPADE